MHQGLLPARILQVGVLKVGKNTRKFLSLDLHVIISNDADVLNGCSYFSEGLGRDQRKNIPSLYMGVLLLL